MALDVKVKIDLAKPIGSVGFGMPLIVSVGSQSKAVVVCYSLEDVKNAGYAENTNAYKAAAIMLSQDEIPERFSVVSITNAASVSDALNAAGDFRQIMVTAESGEVDYTGFIEYVNTTEGKMLFARVGGVSDISDIESDSNRVIIFVHSDVNAEAALAGLAAAYAPGSFTYKNLILRGIKPQGFTESEIAAITEAKAITFVTKAGDNVTTEGITASGEYIDIIDSMDYVIQNIEYRTQRLLNKHKKIPYDNNGIAVLETATIGVLSDAYNKGIVASTDNGTPDFEVKYALRSATTAEDRVKRRYIGGTFRFALAGAVHTVEVNGEITI